MLNRFQALDYDVGIIYTRLETVNLLQISTMCQPVAIIKWSDHGLSHQIVHDRGPRPY